MGKKARTKKGAQRAAERKGDKSIAPPPPPPLEVEVGSLTLLSEPEVPGSKHKVLGQDGYDDGGVADLTLLIDLEDHALRRKRGENAYFQAIRSDVIPRVKEGPLAVKTRREQKIHLATILFGENDIRVDDEETTLTPSEIYAEPFGEEDETVVQRRVEGLKKAKSALKLAIYLGEPACACISLTEIAKRMVYLDGERGKEVALRCCQKAIKMCGDGFYDNDLIMMEAEDVPKVDPKYEENATSPGLTNPAFLKYSPMRSAVMCKRAAYLHHGNALAALGRLEEARESYFQVLPLLAPEPRCCRVDWERSSTLVNIGNTYSRQGTFDKADEYYKQAEQLGVDHIEADGNKVEGLGLKMVAMRARAFALRNAGKEDEAKELLRQVIALQIEFSAAMATSKAELKEEMKRKEEKEQAAAMKKGLEATSNDNPHNPAVETK